MADCRHNEMGGIWCPPLRLVHYSEGSLSQISHHREAGGVTNQATLSIWAALRIANDCLKLQEAFWLSLKKKRNHVSRNVTFFLAKMYYFPLRRVRNRKVLHCLSLVWLKQVGAFSLHQSNISPYQTSYVMSPFKLHILIWVCFKVLPFCWHSPVCFSMDHIFSFAIYLLRSSRKKKEKNVKC